MRMLRACRENLNVSAGVLASIIASLPTCGLWARSSEQADALAFSVPEGVYTNSISLQVTAAAPAVVRFTINGQEPEETSPIWNGALTISNCTLVNVRGHYSLKYPKHSYSLKTVDAAGEPVKAPLLGLAKESEWALYAPFPDKTLMRDVLAYELSNEMGQWAPRTRFVELFVSDTTGRLSKSNYAGVYVLEEKIKRDKNRVNIAKLEPADTEEP